MTADLVLGLAISIVAAFGSALAAMLETSSADPWAYAEAGRGGLELEWRLQMDGLREAFWC